jgi:hypothetical protein
MAQAGARAGARVGARDGGARVDAGVAVGREAVLRYRVHAQGLDREPDGRHRATGPDVLDLGVQESGTGGALWALANRGVPLTADAWPRDELALVWSVRGAPHAYRRRDLPAVEAALRPYSPADAAKRIFDASKPLAAAGIPADEALASVASHLRAIVTTPTVKGVVSTRLTAAVTEPYLRFCRPCNATHLYEMPFRLGALHAGLELEPGTSPPVLRRIPRWPADHLRGVTHGEVPFPQRLDPVRAYLHHLGPGRPADVAAYLDAPVKEIDAHWPTDVAEVEVEGVGRRWVLDADLDALRSAGGTGADPPTVRLLGPFDLFLQARDRETLVPSAEHRKALWPTLGRPGAVLVGGEIVGTWRPRASGGSLRLLVDRWVPWDDDVERAVHTQAERLADHRGATLTAVE